MSECRALEKKNQRVEPGLVVAQRTTDKADFRNETKKLSTPESTALSPFVSKGLVCLEGSKEKVPINIIIKRHWSYTIINFKQCIAVL